MYLFEKHVVILLDERYYKDTTSFPILTASLPKSFNPWQTYILRMSCFEEVENMEKVAFLCGKQYIAN